jgi:hypothetical protein
VGVEAELVRRTPSGAILPWYLNEDGTEPVKDEAVLAKLDEIADLLRIPSRSIWFQPEASAEWIVVHGLNGFPNVTVVDSTGRVVHGALEYIDANTVRISFNAAFAGAAFIS